MIKEKEVNVKIGSWNNSHYKKLGYENVKNGNLVKVKIEDLTLGSHTIITAICDICGTEKQIEYKTYCRNIKRNNIYNCDKCQYDLMKINLNEKYGVENVSHLPDVKNKIRKENISNAKDRLKKAKQTNLKKYGVENVFQNQDIIKNNVRKVRKTMVEKGRWVDEKFLTPWQKYKKDVMKLTHKFRKILFENWNGYDYYDNEYIKNNLNLNCYCSNYPTIDHKISIKYGFDNNIPTEYIANINNLCITKKCINTSKHIKTEIEYALKLKNK